jgi:hypothetical protein
MSVKSAITDLIARAASHNAAALARASQALAGPGERALSASTIKTMRTQGWEPQTLANLALLERTLAHVESASAPVASVKEAG